MHDDALDFDRSRLVFHVEIISGNVVVVRIINAAVVDIRIRCGLVQI